MSHPVASQPVAHGCLDSQELQALVDGNLSESRQIPLLARLENCPCCQQRLEALAAGGANLAELCQHACEAQPVRGSAYWPAIERVRNSLTETFVPRATPADPLPAGDPLASLVSPLLSPVPPGGTPSGSPAGGNSDRGTAPRGNSARRSGDYRPDFLAPATDPAYIGRLAHFDIARVIGRGGMGVVLEGFDTRLQRSVAIKVLDPELAHNDVARQRFCREARAAAAIAHEHVVAVHQVEHDEASQLPFLVMQLVQGETLEQRLAREGKLSPHEAVRIGMQTAAGLAAAHAEGLIHRDVKPGNILLESPSGRVKLTDFGLARCVEDVKLTQTGFVTGTPLYMAPEQALGEEVDERSDLFSLGAVMYEALAAEPPFAGNTPLAVLRKIAEATPHPLAQHNPEVPPWLSELIVALLSKKREQRPGSAAEVAQIFARHLTDWQTVSPLQIPAVPCPNRLHASGTTKPPTKHLWGALLAGVSLGLTIAGGALATKHFVGNRGGLNGSTVQSTIFPGATLASTPATVASPAFKPTAVLAGNSGTVWSIAVSPDGETLAMGIDDGTVRLWDVNKKRVRHTITVHTGPVLGTSFSPDGHWLATGLESGVVKIWDAQTAEQVRTLEIGKPVRSIAFSPLDTSLAVGCQTGEVEVWDVELGTRSFKTDGHKNFVASVAWSVDGSMLGSAGGDKVARLWDARTGAALVTLSGHNGAVYSIAFTRDGQRVVTGSWDRTLRIWESGTGTQLKVLEGNSEDIWAVVCSPRGDLTASVGEDRTVRLWDLSNGTLLASLQDHTGTLYTASFSRCGEMLATGGRDGTVRIWDVPGILQEAAPKNPSATRHR